MAILTSFFLKVQCCWNIKSLHKGMKIAIGFNILLWNAFCAVFLNHNVSFAGVIQTKSFHKKLNKKENLPVSMLY